jgi:hypothetical protein
MAEGTVTGLIEGSIINCLLRPFPAAIGATARATLVIFQYLFTYFKAFDNGPAALLIRISSWTHFRSPS